MVQINSRVTALNLAGNNLTSEGLEHIVKMMVENDFITRLVRIEIIYHLHIMMMTLNPINGTNLPLTTKSLQFLYSNPSIPFRLFCDFNSCHMTAYIMRCFIFVSVVIIQ